MLIPFLLSNWMRFSNLFEFVPEVAMCGHVASNKHAGLISMYVQLVSGFSCNCTVGKWRPEDAEVVEEFTKCCSENLVEKCRKTSWKWSDRTCNLRRELGMSTAQQLPWSMHHRSCSDLNEAKSQEMPPFRHVCRVFGIIVSWIFHEICWYMFIADIICWFHRCLSCTSCDMSLYDCVISCWMRCFAYWRRGLMCSTRGWIISAWICMMLGREATTSSLKDAATCALDV